MNTIRPQFPPPTQTPAAPRPGGDARAAFFQAALTQASAAPVATPVTAVREQTFSQPQTQRPNVQATRTEEPPQRYLRPGSLLDIKV